MKDYKPVNWIEHSLYMRIIYTIRDLDRLKEEHDLIIEESPMPPDGQPRGTGTSDPTFSKANKVLRLHDDIVAVESALQSIPEEYRKGLMRNIINRERFPEYADRKTWSKWKRRFIQKVGENLGLL